jgi:protein-tyrosine phosphatase
LEYFDYILAMDQSNYLHLMAMALTEDERQKIKLLRDFDPQAIGKDVPDPYYSGTAGFDEAYKIIQRAVRALMDAVIEESK